MKPPTWVTRSHRRRGMQEVRERSGIFNKNLSLTIQYRLLLGGRPQQCVIWLAIPCHTSENAHVVYTPIIRKNSVFLTHYRMQWFPFYRHWTPYQVRISPWRVLPYVVLQLFSAVACLTWLPIKWPSRKMKESKTKAIHEAVSPSSKTFLSCWLQKLHSPDGLTIENAITFWVCCVDFNSQLAL